MNNRRPGFALMAALWLVVLVGITGYELSLHSHMQRLSIANALERAQGEAAVEAGLNTARGLLENRLGRPLSVISVGSSQQKTFDPWLDAPHFTPDTLVLGNERVVVRMFDAGSRLQINRATEDDWRRFLMGARLDAGKADRLAQRIMDWKDLDDFRRPEGAERAEYLRLGARRMPANVDFVTVAELQSVDGMTPELYARIRDHLTTLGTGQVNLNTATEPVLHSLPGLGDETIATILSLQRSSTLIRSLDDLTPRLSSDARASVAGASGELLRRVSFDVREVVAESEGWADGSPVRVRGEALYARGGDALFTVWQKVSR